MRTLSSVRGKGDGLGSLQIEEITPGLWAVVDHGDPRNPRVVTTANTYWDLQRLVKRSTRAQRLHRSTIGYSAVWLISLVVMVVASIVNVWASVLVVSLTAGFGLYAMAKVGDCVTARRGLRVENPVHTRPVPSPIEG